MYDVKAVVQILKVLDHCEAMLDFKKKYFIDFLRYLHEIFTRIEKKYFKSLSDLKTAS